MPELQKQRSRFGRTTVPRTSSPGVPELQKQRLRFGCRQRIVATGLAHAFHLRHRGDRRYTVASLILFTNLQRATMLRKIKIENFKCFKSLVFDLKAGDYAFNSEIVKNGLVNKALIYGANGSGKTSLGVAIFDLVQHLTDNDFFHNRLIDYYRNLNTQKECVGFEYTFMLNQQEVVYRYEKNSSRELLNESLSIDGELLVDYDYGNEDRRFVSEKLRGSLTISLPDNRLSVLKYIYRNTPTGFHQTFSAMMRFCDAMLWFRSLSDGNDYCGLTKGSVSLEKWLFDSGKLKDFETYLSQYGLIYHLGFETDDGGPRLYAYFGRKREKARFSSIASAGTKVLWLLYLWRLEGKDRLSLLFIDEFDAFYHFQTAEQVVRELNGQHDFQTILTTHNTYLMQNSLTRPDCCYLLTNNKIKSLKKSTEREIREAHNLEKMYINGAFVI